MGRGWGELGGEGGGVGLLKSDVPQYLPVQYVCPSD